MCKKVLPVYPVLLAVLILFSVSCTTGNKDIAERQGVEGSENITVIYNTISFDIQNTRWSLLEIDGKEIIPGSHVSLDFDKGGASGSSGCNHYGAGYLVDKYGKISFLAIFLTAMNCPFPPGVTAQEKRYIEALRESVKYEISAGGLVLYDSENRELLVFEGEPVYDMDPSKLVGTSWKCRSVNDKRASDELNIILNFATASNASGKAGCFTYRMNYQAEGDRIRWGFSSSRTGELSLDLETEALDYLDKMMWVTAYRQTAENLELYTTRGDTLVYEPYSKPGVIE
jgi:heat shock protein HslJ